MIASFLFSALAGFGPAALMDCWRSLVRPQHDIHRGREQRDLVASRGHGAFEMIRRELHLLDNIPARIDVVTLRRSE